MSPPSAGLGEYHTAEREAVMRFGNDLGLTPQGYVLFDPVGAHLASLRPRIRSSASELCSISASG